MIVIILCHGLEQLNNVSLFDKRLFGDSKVLVVVSDITNTEFLQFPCIKPTRIFNGFNAGYNRDCGLVYALNMYGLDDVVFIDGDCTPSITWTSCVEQSLLSNSNLVCSGARDGINDPRLQKIDWQNEFFTPSMQADTSVTATKLRDVVAHRFTWSCNLGIGKTALLKLREAGLKLHGSTRIFSPVFDGTWGGEDTGLGVVAWYAGCDISCLPASTATVQHKQHDLWHVTNKNLKKVPEYANHVHSILS